jgi:hypothetical protein
MAKESCSRVPSFASNLVAPPFASNHLYPHLVLLGAHPGQFNDGAPHPTRTYTLYYTTFNKRQPNYYSPSIYPCIPRSTHCDFFSLYSVNNLDKIPKDRVGSRRRPVARTVAAGAAARATDHYRPSPKRRRTGEGGEAYITYILVHF